VVVEIDNKNGDFGGFVTWPFRQFGNSGVDQEYPDLIITLFRIRFLRFSGRERHALGKI
jgi:hypothetical protein